MTTVRSLLWVLLLSLLICAGVARAGTQVTMRTSLGSIQIELDAERAPQTVDNFLAYVDQQFYDGTLFHRVIADFMIQGGGYDRHDQRQTTLPPIPNEADNGLKNLRGTIAMARTRAIDSATSQFYINLVDNPSLDHRGPQPDRYGYAVFGRVMSGMDVVDRIGRRRTLVKSTLFRSYPDPPVIIESIRRSN